MDRHNTGNRTTASLADRSTCLCVDPARIEACRELLWIQIAALLVYVHKLWPGTCLRDRLGSRQKGMWGRKDNVATLDADGEECKAQRISPTGYANTVLCTTKCPEGSLELLDHRSAAKSAVMQGCPEDMQQLFLKFLVWRHQVNKRNH